MWEWYDIIFSGLFFAISAIKVEITRRWWSFSKVYSISGFSWANFQEKEKLNLGMIEYLKNSQGNFKQISQISWKSEEKHSNKYQGTIPFNTKGLFGKILQRMCAMPLLQNCFHSNVPKRNLKREWRREWSTFCSIEKRYFRL